MATKEQLSIELDVETAQEIYYTLETLANKIGWVLENQPPKKPLQLSVLKARLKLVKNAEKYFKDALNKRALTTIN